MVQMNEDMHIVLSKYFSGQLSADEASEVLKWRDSSADNAAEFQLLQQVWNDVDIEAPAQFDAGAAWVKVDRQISAQTPVKARIVSFYKPLLAVAACLLLAFGIWYMVSQDRQSLQNFVADADGKELILEDGSHVYLRKGSTLSYPEHFSTTSREVALTGEAFFEVAHDVQKPFSVVANEARITVLGTSFMIHTGADSVGLIVKTGRVAFGDKKNATQQIVVVAGERALYAHNKAEKQSATDPNFDAWKTHELKFEQVPLEQVARTLSDYFRISLTINPADAAEIRSKLVNTTFKNKSLSEVFAEFEQTLGCKFTQVSDKQYQISLR